MAMFHCINLLFILLNLYNYILLGGIILSWFPGLMRFRFFRFIRTMSDWYMGPFQGFVVLGPLDFTPVIGFLIYDAIVTAIFYSFPGI